MIRGVLLDLAGVVYLGDHILPAAKSAVDGLRSTGLPLGFITNTTRTSKTGIIDRLARMGLDVSPDELVTPAEAARAWLARHKRSPHLLVHPALTADFQDLAEYRETAVVVGDAGRDFTYERLNAAFRALVAGADFLALAKNRTFRDADNELSLDAGAFVTALEYASGRQAILLGKPSPDFYAAAVARLGCDAADTVMVGDDVEADVSGARASCGDRCGAPGANRQVPPWRRGGRDTATDRGRGRPPDGSRLDRRASERPSPEPMNGRHDWPRDRRSELICGMRRTRHSTR